MPFFTPLLQFSTHFFCSCFFVGIIKKIILFFVSCCFISVPASDPVWLGNCTTPGAFRGGFHNVSQLFTLCLIYVGVKRCETPPLVYHHTPLVCKAFIFFLLSGLKKAEGSVVRELNEMSHFACKQSPVFLYTSLFFLRSYRTSLLFSA